MRCHERGGVWTSWCPNQQHRVSRRQLATHYFRFSGNWKRVCGVSVFGVYLVTRNLLPLLLKSERGVKTVMGITSTSSHWAGHSIAMGMSKLAPNRFMEFLGGQFENKGWWVICLHPGGAKTRMSQEDGKVPKEFSELAYPPLFEFVWDEAVGKIADVEQWIMILLTFVLGWSFDLLGN